MKSSSLYSNDLRSQSDGAPLECGECVADKCDTIVSAWTEFSEQGLEHLVDSMPERTEIVLHPVLARCA